MFRLRTPLLASAALLAAACTAEPPTGAPERPGFSSGKFAPADSTFTTTTTTDSTCNACRGGGLGSGGG